MPHTIHAIDAVLPLVQGWVATLGRAPVGMLALAALVALWLVGRILSDWVLVVPGLVAGAALGAWLALAHGWHPVLAGLAGLALAWGIYQVCAGLFFARLVLALVGGALALATIGHLAAGALDTGWAISATLVAAWSVGSLLHRFVMSENHALAATVLNLVDDLRGE
jgi:hypothetical protein